MKFIIYTCLLLLSFNLGAQTLTKAEKKILKQELKNYKKTPESYKAMKDKNANTIKEQETIIEELSNQIASLNAENNRLKDSVSWLYDEIETLLQLEENRGQIPAGTVYQVQLGFYEKLDLKSFNRAGIMVKAEETGSSKRYVIGHFFDLNAAKNFNRDIQKLGVKDSFVSKYVDGVRDMTFDAQKTK